MAAYCACMCFVRGYRGVRAAHSLARILIRTDNNRSLLALRANQRIIVHKNFLYSTQAPAGGGKGITDEILKEKLAAERSNEADDKKSVGAEESSQQEKKSGRWTGKNAWKLGLVALGGWILFSGGALFYVWGSPPLDPEGNVIEDEFSNLPKFTAMFKRAFKEVNIFTKSIQEPSRQQLLPKPLEYPYYQPPYTLVMEMTGVLVHPDWTYSTGWRFKKRPHIDYFLEQVGPPLFEVVIYSQEQGMTADPLVSSLDPKGFIMYRLYRDATRYMNGHHLKDLACLNRDLSKVIMIDWNPKATQLQPRNTLNLRRWLGEEGDHTLVDLAHFLKTIAASEVEDVRSVLEYYSQFDDPVAAFKENQRKLQEEQERMAEEYKKQEEKKRASGWGLGFLRRR